MAERKIGESWSEIYRPSLFSEYVGQRAPFEYLTGALRECKTIQHLIFHGPPGVGKTSLIKLYLDEYLRNAQNKSQYVLFLNASVIGNIENVRTRITPFCKLPQKQLVRIIVLDEADKMSTVCQSALRKIIETYSRKTRFVFIVNQLSKLHAAIQSRCQTFTFYPLEPDSCVAHLHHIANDMGFNVASEDLHDIVKYDNGDMRKCVSHLQYFVSYLSYNEDEKETKETKHILDIVLDRIPFVFLKRVRECVMDSKRSTTDEVRDLSLEFERQGYSLQDLLEQLCTLLCSHVDEDSESEPNDIQLADAVLKINRLYCELSTAQDVSDSQQINFMRLF